MNSTRLDGFVRVVANRLTRRTGLGLLTSASLPLLAFTGAADAKKKNFTLCVQGKTIKKPKKKARKLLKQGATRGRASMVVGAIRSRATPRASRPATAASLPTAPVTMSVRTEPACPRAAATAAPAWSS